MSKNRRRFIPNFDSLESRLVPANVTVSFRNNLLSITGDNDANSISITNNEDGSFTVASTDDGTVNNGTDFTFNATRNFGVRIDMRGGDDVVDVVGGNGLLRANSSVRLGAGFDTLTMDNLRAADDFLVDGGADDDVITITNGGFDEDARIIGGSGNDTITVDNVFFAEDARIDGGSGDDIIDIVNGRFHDEDGRVIGGSGFDTITITGSFFDEDSRVEGGNGDDEITINDSVFFHDFRLDAGSGADVVTIFDGRFDFDSEFRLGSGNDEILIGGASFFNKEAYFDGGSGFDTFTHDGTNTWARKHKVKSFELFQFGEVTPPEGDGLIANPDTATVAPGGTVTFDVVGNDVAPEGGTLDLTTLAIIQEPTRGTATVNADGTITYVNTSGTAGQTDSLTYSISDDLGNTATGTVTITLGQQTGGTVTATADTATVTPGVPSIINVAANDITTEGSINLGSIQITQQPTSGTVTVNQDGTVTYTTNAGATATTDTFQYVISNSLGTSSSPGTVNVTINQPLAANADIATVNEGGTTTINLINNDTTPPGTTINAGSIVITQQPTNGTVTVNQNGTVTFTQNGSETTTSTFQYTFTNSAGTTSTPGTVTVTVTPVNDAPVASSDNFTLPSGVSSIINLIANDLDPEGTLNPASIVIVGPATQASVTVNADGTVNYLSNAGATGTDSFTYTVADQQGLVSNIGTVTITLT